MAAPLLIGINYPWTLFRGTPNYGCDFGVNVWRSHGGVSAHAADVRRDFDAMAEMGVQIARWFVFTDGRGGVRWDAARQPAGLADAFFEDMDAALAIARDTGVRLCLVLMDYSWMLHREERDAAGERLFVTSPGVLATGDGLARLLDALIDPFLARYGTQCAHADLGRSIHSIDVINEPDWVTRGLAPDRSRDAVTGARRLRQPFSRTQLRSFVRAVADRVHRHTDALVTVGGGRVRFAEEWDKPAYGLDFVQVHSYPDVEDPDRDRSLVGLPSAVFGLSKPILIGECPANGPRLHPADHHPPAFSLADYLTLARDGGYLGAWPWSFNGVDDFGAVDAGAMRAWVDATPKPS